MKTLSKFLSESSRENRLVAGGSGKGKKFYSKDTTVTDHLSAMNYHSNEAMKAKKAGNEAKALKHGYAYYDHKEQIEALGNIGNHRKD